MSENEPSSTPRPTSTPPSVSGGGFDAHVMNRIFERLEKLDGKFHEISVSMARMDGKADRLHGVINDKVCRVEKSVEQQTAEIRKLNDWKIRIMAIIGFAVVLVSIVGTLYKVMS